MEAAIIFLGLALFAGLGFVAAAIKELASAMLKFNEREFMVRMREFKDY